MTTRVGTVCTGYGGLDEAVLSFVSGRLCWVADNDPDVAALLAIQHPRVPNLGDITQVDWSRVEQVDVFVAGTPCQDVSCAGSRVGMLPGNRSGLWSYARYAISVLRPSLVVFENVRGITSARAHSDVEPCEICMGKAADRPLRALGAVLGDLSALGYDAEWRNIRASDAGACHQRERIFVLAWLAAANSGGEF